MRESSLSTIGINRSFDASSCSSCYQVFRMPVTLCNNIIPQAYIKILGISKMIYYLAMKTYRFIYIIISD